MRVIDLSGQRFSSLFVLGQEGSIKRGSIWKCRCDCGKIVKKLSIQLRRTSHPAQFCSHSCELLKKKMLGVITTHGKSKHPAYMVWRGMKRRCYDPRQRSWKYYGGRGITVCERWLESFENFWEDMGRGYKKGLTIDRKNNSGNYTPKNCWWATYSQNNRNKRNNIKGLPSNFQDIARERGMKRGCLYRRISRGLNWDQVINTPMHVQLNVKPRKKYERKQPLRTRY